MDFNNFCAGGLDNPVWWHRLLEDSVYANQTHCRWQELRQGKWSDDYLMNYIDSIAATLEEASQRHFQRWPILGTYVWPNNFIGNTYQEEIDYLKSWIVDRAAWMDSNMFGRPCDLSLGFNQQRQSIETIIYPNPIQNGETLHVQANQSIENIALMDGLGKTIFIKFNELGTQDQSNSISISLEKIPAGLYTLRITQKNKVISFKKILVL
jgi:hypothetical protein